MPDPTIGVAVAVAAEVWGRDARDPLQELLQEIPVVPAPGAEAAAGMAKVLIRVAPEGRADPEDFISTTN